jgi:BNR/Asp-box repeat.
MSLAKNVLLALATAVGACALATGASAGPFTVAPLTTASGPSPFAGCTVGAAPGSVLYPNAEEEPWVDVNPTNPDNLIAVWQQDRWSDGGAHGLVTAVTHDAGLTWTRTFPHFSTCAGGTAQNGGDFDRSSDPWVSFGPDGTAYQVSLSFNATNNVNAVLASRSTDGGDHWSEPWTILRDSGERDVAYAFNDKESVTADALTPGYAYAAWDRFVTPSGTSRASIEGLIHSRSFREPIWFSRTTDGGLTWEPARNIYDRSEFNGTIGSQIVVAKNGDLLDFFDEFFIHKNADKSRGEWMSVIRSTDKGVTWSKDSIKIAPSRERVAFDPDTGRNIRAEGGLPEVAIDRASGALYVVWQDASFSGVDEIAFSMSTDNGQTWSTPIKVNQTPRSSTAANQQAFVAGVHVTPNGTVAVTYYDFRNNDPNPGVPTDYWIVHCHSDCASPASWTGNENRLTTTSFDIEQAPAARGPFGYFLGEYEGLTNIGNAFVPVFVAVNNGNPANRTDVFSTTAG